MITRIYALSILLLATLFAPANHLAAQSSNRSVASPDGAHQVTVDRLAPSPGQDQFSSGKMVIRATPADGSVAKQKYIESSQVRVIQPPQWLDNNLCAFTYNIAKNAHGMVYYDLAKNHAVQLEFVVTSRPMGADRKIVQELNSLEVVVHVEDQPPIRIENITRDDRSVFPLALGTLPPFENKPYRKVFHARVIEALDAYRDFSQKAGVETLVPESASESFNESGTTMAALLCADKKSYLVTVPIRSGTPAKTLSAASLIPIPDVELTCSHHAAGTRSDEEPMDTGGRFVTHWTTNDQVAIDVETFDADDDSSVRTILYQQDATGALIKQDTPTTATETVSPAL